MTSTLTLDTTGKIIAWGEEAERLLGYSADDALGQSVELIIPPHLRARHNVGFSRFVKTGVSNLPEVLTTPALHKSGHIVTVLISVEPIYGGDRRHIIAVQARMQISGALA